MSFTYYNLKFCLEVVFNINLNISRFNQLAFSRRRHPRKTLSRWITFEINNAALIVYRQLLYGGNPTKTRSSRRFPVMCLNLLLQDLNLIADGLEGLQRKYKIIPFEYQTKFSQSTIRSV